MNGNHSPEISILIPVYNVEKMLPRCLDSVLSQSFKDFEIVCVNDKSPDNSLAILREYAEKDPRVKIIDKPRNEGLMMARYTGYKNAAGRYFFFLDSDDFIPGDALQSLHSKAVETGADIVVGEMALVNTAGRKVMKHRPEKTGESYLSYLKSILHWNTPSLCGSLFSQSLFDGYSYTALMNHGFSEDRILLTEILCQRRPKVATVDSVTYYYWQNNESITRSIPGEKAVTEQFKALFRCYDTAENAEQGLTADNRNFIIRYISLYVEKGCDPAMIKGIDPRIGQLTEFRVMKQYVGTRMAAHTWLCCNLPFYRRAMHGLRLIIRKLQGKD